MKQSSLISILFSLTLFGCSTNPDDAELENEVVTIEASYIAWGCICANWMTSEDLSMMNKLMDEGVVYDCENEGTCFNIEPGDPDLEIPEEYWSNPNSTRRFRFIGRFYKKKQEYFGHDDKKLYAKTFKYSNYEYLGDQLNNVANHPYKKRILVLPPYDEIANAGKSPTISKCLEKAIAGNQEFELIPFPLKKLMGVPYQNVYDKKFIKVILDKVNPDIVIMTKLDYKLSSDKLSTSTWDFSTRIYLVDEDIQFDSKLKAENVAYEEICNKVQQGLNALIEEMK